MLIIKISASVCGYRYDSDNYRGNGYASLVFGVLVGYFMGREHIKYELRAAIEVAADGFRRSLGGGSEAQETKAESTREAPPFALFLLKKEFREANFPKIEAGIIIEVAFDNLTGKDVRAFR